LLAGATYLRGLLFSAFFCEKCTALLITPLFTNGFLWIMAGRFETDQFVSKSRFLVCFFVTAFNHVGLGCWLWASFPGMPILENRLWLVQFTK